jgi:hypothetical protein
MSEHRSFLPTRREICDRLTAVAREQKALRELLKLSVLEENERRQQEERARDGVAKLQESRARSVQCGGSSGG